MIANVERYERPPVALRPPYLIHGPAVTREQEGQKPTATSTAIFENMTRCAPFRYTCTLWYRIARVSPLSIASDSSISSDSRHVSVPLETDQIHQ